MSSYVSHDALYHFVGRSCRSDSERFKILKTIINTGVISHPPHNIDWGTYEFIIPENPEILNGELVTPNMVCFCDIPYNHLHIHMKKYSRFGLSLSKHYIFKRGGRPVFYYPYASEDTFGNVFGITALKDLQTQFVHFRRMCEAEFGENPSYTRTVGAPPKTFAEACLIFQSQMSLSYLAFLKPFEVTLPEDHPDNFYMEREWRMIGNLKFSITDIHQIVVSQDYLEEAKNEWPNLETIIVPAPSDYSD